MSGSLSLMFQTLFPDLVRRLPPELARDLVILAGSLYFAAKLTERLGLLSNVADLLGPGERTEKVKAGVLEHLSEHYFEKLLVANKQPEFIRDFLAERMETVSMKALDESLSLGRGVLAVTAHWGAVELIPAFLANRGYPLTVILETRTARLRHALERKAEESGVELLIASRGDSVLNGIFDALKRGRILLTQVDEVDAWRRRKSRTIRLFDKRLFFDHSLDLIAKRSLAPAVGLYCERKKGLRYRFCCEELAMDPLSVDVAARALSMWESYVKQSPEQWYQWGKWQAMKAGEIRG